MVNTREDIVTEDETKINVSQLKNNLFTYQLEEYLQEWDIINKSNR